MTAQTSLESSQSTQTSDPTPESVEASQGAQDAPGTHDPDAQLRSREAAGYRVRLREAEAQLQERDAVIGALRARLDDVDRESVERVAEQRGMQSPADLWTQTSLVDLRADDGTLDSELVQQRVDAVLKERPHWRRPSMDLGQGPRAGLPSRDVGLSQLLGKGRR